MPASMPCASTGPPLATLPTHLACRSHHHCFCFSWFKLVLFQAVAASRLHVGFCTSQGTNSSFCLHHHACTSSIKQLASGTPSEFCSPSTQARSTEVSDAVSQALLAALDLTARSPAAMPSPAADPWADPSMAETADDYQVHWTTQALGVYRDALSAGLRPRLHVLERLIACLRLPLDPKHGGAPASSTQLPCLPPIKVCAWSSVGRCGEAVTPQIASKQHVEDCMHH